MSHEGRVEDNDGGEIVSGQSGRRGRYINTAGTRGARLMEKQDNNSLGPACRTFNSHKVGRGSLDVLRRRNDV